MANEKKRICTSIPAKWVPAIRAIELEREAQGESYVGLASFARRAIKAELDRESSRPTKTQGGKG